MPPAEAPPLASDADAATDDTLVMDPVGSEPAGRRWRLRRSDVERGPFGRFNILVEAITAFAAAAAMTVAGFEVDTDPIQRIGQVAGLAQMQLYFAIAAFAMIAIVIVGWRFRDARAFLVAWSCACLAGLATGLVAGGIAVGLNGTPWALNALNGDAGVIHQWVSSILAHDGMQRTYPPMFVYATAFLAWIRDTNPSYALQDMQIIVTAIIGPIAYLSWRSITSPVWALVIGVLAALPFLDPYKPYTYIVLLAIFPLLIKLVDALRGAEGRRWRSIAGSGALLGLGAGALFMLYSGWFVWFAPGAVVAVLVAFPWRAWRGGLLLLGVALAVFLSVSWYHLIPLATESGGIKDPYFYFDTNTQPAYIAMWRGDMPGVTGLWPPPGELGGVGVFTLLLAAGCGAAIWLGGATSIVLVPVLAIAGAWLSRMYIASNSFDDMAVQLYPRTTMAVLCGLLVLVGVSVMLLWRRFNPPVIAPENRDPRDAVGLRRLVAVLASLSFVFASAGGAMADQYMPAEGVTTATGPVYSLGTLAHMAHTLRMEGTNDCSPYIQPQDKCRP